MQLTQVKQKVHALWTALILLSVFFGVELSAGLWSHSLSLLADAEHMLSDVAALGLALVATWVSQSISRQAKLGRYRLDVLAALVNGIALACIALWIVKEAVLRLQSPAPEILGVPMLVTALIGVAVNSFNVFCLHKCSHHDLNIRGAFFHLLADLAGSVGAVLAAIAVLWLNWTWADGVISLGVAGLTTLLAASLVMQSISCLHGQPTQLLDAACNCDRSPEDVADCPDLDRQQAEKLLFPSLQERVIR